MVQRIAGRGRPYKRRTPDSLELAGSPDNPRANEELAALLAEADLFREDHLIAGLVLTAPPADTAMLAAIGSSSLFFIAKAAGVIASKIASASFRRMHPFSEAVAAQSNRTIDIER